MLLMMFSALVWAPISTNHISSDSKKTELHKKSNEEISGFLSSYAYEETEEEEFSEEDNFTFLAAYNFISSFTSLIQNKSFQRFHICQLDTNLPKSKLFIEIRCLII